MKRYIFAFASSKSKIANEIEDHTRPVANALAQLYLFPNSQYENHWRQEVYASLNEVKRFKGSKKYPNADFIYNNTWKINQEDVPVYLQWAVYHEDDLTPIQSYSETEFNDIATEYFKWLAHVLSKNGQVLPKQVYQKLDELGL